MKDLYLPEKNPVFSKNVIFTQNTHPNYLQNDFLTKMNSSLPNFI